LLGRLGRLDFSAGKFPQTSQGDACRALLNQQSPLMLDDRDGDGRRFHSTAPSILAGG
jgi:hypothetical protein